jgi:dCMP deaminase
MRTPEEHAKTISKMDEALPDRKRPPWDVYFMDIAHFVATRSTCLRRHVGAIVVKDKRILSTGYNGAPSGLTHCLDVGCLREELNIPSGERHELCRALHAEQNSIIQAAVHGVAIKGATLYATNQPCIICSKMIINAGIVRVVYDSGYPDEMSLQFLSQAGIELVRSAGEDR